MEQEIENLTKIPGIFVCLENSEYYLTLSSMSCSGYFIQSFNNTLKIYDSTKYTSLLDLQDTCKIEVAAVVRI